MLLKSHWVEQLENMERFFCYFVTKTTTTVIQNKLLWQTINKYLETFENLHV